MDLVRKINHAHEMSAGLFTGNHEDLPTHVLMRPEDIDKCNEKFGSTWYPIGMRGSLVKGFVDHNVGWEIISIDPIRTLTRSQATDVKQNGWQRYIWLV